MGCEFYVEGEARGQNLVAQLLAKGFSQDGGDELLSPSGDGTGVVVSAGDRLTGREDWRCCGGFDDLVAALHQVDGLESVELRREWQEDDKESHVFRNGAWYALVVVEEYVPEESRSAAVRAAEAALKQFDLSCCAAPALGRRSGHRDSAPGAVRILNAMYAYVADSPAGALAPDVSGGLANELAALNEAIEALRRISGVAEGVDVLALARQAVDAMGDVFWDADKYPDERMDCPQCGKEDVRVGDGACPACGFGPLSKSQAIHDDCVACVVRAIETALAQQSAAPDVFLPQSGEICCRICGIVVSASALADHGDLCWNCHGR